MDYKSLYKSGAAIVAAGLLNGCITTSGNTNNRPWAMYEAAKTIPRQALAIAIHPLEMAGQPPEYVSTSQKEQERFEGFFK
ncbi:MAG: hypothetical protein ACMXYG_05785 [Candidatus Woesearchaeota archaeon]